MSMVKKEKKYPTNNMIRNSSYLRLLASYYRRMQYCIDICMIDFCVLSPSDSVSVYSQAVLQSEGGGDEG